MTDKLDKILGQFKARQESARQAPRSAPSPAAWNEADLFAEEDRRMAAQPLIVPRRGTTPVVPGNRYDETTAFSRAPEGIDRLVESQHAFMRAMDQRLDRLVEAVEAGLSLASEVGELRKLVEQSIRMQYAVLQEQRGRSAAPTPVGPAGGFAHMPVVENHGGGVAERFAQRRAQDSLDLTEDSRRHIDDLVKSTPKLKQEM